MGELVNLPNIGTEMERQLNRIGVYTYEDLCRMGAQGAWLEIQKGDDSA